jgi:hypothetical protein
MTFQYYKVGFYKGFLILEINISNTQIYYEFCKSPILEFSDEKFSNTDQVKEFIDNILSDKKKLWCNTRQAKHVCDKCFKHYDLNAEIEYSKTKFIKFLNVREQCYNCGNSFLNFTLTMN